MLELYSDMVILPMGHCCISTEVNTDNKTHTHTDTLFVWVFVKTVNASQRSPSMLHSKHNANFNNVLMKRLGGLVVLSGDEPEGLSGEASGLMNH